MSPVDGISMTESHRKKKRIRGKPGAGEKPSGPLRPVVREQPGSPAKR